MNRNLVWPYRALSFVNLRFTFFSLSPVLQVSFGMLSLLDSPLFKIYVLGQAAEGELARPFKKQGLMASLTGPMEGLAAKVMDEGFRPMLLSNQPAMRFVGGFSR